MAEQVSPLGIPDGPTQEQINEWKREHGDIFVATFDEEKYIYRPLKRFEYKQIMLLGQTADSRAFVEEKILQMCVVWPKIEVAKLSTLKAGIVSTLVELIMAASNFGITEEPVKL